MIQFETDEYGADAAFYIPPDDPRRRLYMGQVRLTPAGRCEVYWWQTAAVAEDPQTAYFDTLEEGKAFLTTVVMLGNQL